MDYQQKRQRAVLVLDDRFRHIGKRTLKFQTSYRAKQGSSATANSWRARASPLPATPSNCKLPIANTKPPTPSRTSIRIRA